MLPSRPASSAALRRKIRVKKRRVMPPGWTPAWRVIGYTSAVVSGSMAGVAMVLLFRLMMTGETAFAASSWNPGPFWPAMAQTFGFAPAAVPEPSRLTLTFIAMAATLLRRRR